jgi:hypothetical protein
MSDHKKLSPSKFNRVRLCPGSVREEAKYPESEGGTAALDGSRDHLLLEVCIEKGLISATEMIGEKLSNEWLVEFSVDRDRADRVQVAIEYLRTRVMDLNFAPIYSEVKLDSQIMFGRDDMGGTCDIHIVGKDYLEVADYKGGMGAVNLPCDQLDIYSLMILGNYQDHDFKTIRQTIIQPKLANRGENGVIYIEMSVDELLAKRQIYIDAAAASDDPNAPLVPGDEQCKYCKHKGACTSLSNKVMQDSGIKFDDLTAIAHDEPNTMSDDRIVQIMEAIPLIKQFIEGVETEAQRRLEAGKEIAGLKLVRGRGSNDWALAPEDMAERLKKMKVPKEAIWETKIISPAKAKKLCWKTKDGTDAKLTDKQIEMLEKEYIKKSEGALTVALASDKRSAVTISVASMFSATDFSDLPDFLKPRSNTNV